MIVFQKQQGERIQVIDAWHEKDKKKHFKKKNVIYGCQINDNGLRLQAATTEKL